MNKIIFSVAAVALVFSSAACQPEDQPQPAPETTSERVYGPVDCFDTSVPQHIHERFCW